MNNKLKELQERVADTIENYAHSSRRTQAKRVTGVIINHALKIAEQAFIYGRMNDNPVGLEQFLATQGLLGKLPERKFMPAEFYLDKFGWYERTLITVDSKKLMRSYPLPDGEKRKVTNWFNGSIIRFDGKLYMAYRIDAFPWTENTRLCLCEMDQNYQPVESTNWLLPLPSCENFSEDPRLFLYDGKLHLSYADGCAIGVAVLDPDSRSISEHRFLQKPVKMRMEKNWTFFEHESLLYMIYQLQPHVVYEVKGDVITKVANTQHASSWAWGEMRGSSCPYRISSNGIGTGSNDDLFYCFFHSHVSFPEEMREFIHRQYHVGCYVFEAHPPFKVVAVSHEPIISGPYIDPEIPHGGNHNFNIFPCGALFKNDEWVISCGINDYEIGLLKISHDEVVQNLNWL